ncbi:FAD-dependent oxidase [Delitschia confertaspora ATCC 74209]|uniref:FAD-dependent oxidase n=1 Tax=Delitschia confertaspora ATCC 74209 TaxID=1513339 RepID=A0A9P4JD27_9PLEO|nr:FAD-dependent oxidase [Delitschia confertaspora ATCC 74209]
MDLRKLLQNLDNPFSGNTRILFPDDPEFVQKTLRWNTYSSPTYKAVVLPASVPDVQNLITLATANNVSFLVTGGNHGYSTTFSKLQNNLAISMRSFNSVTINATENTMTVGGGTLFSEVYDVLYNAGKEIQGGVCSGVGVVGLTLGGGIGRYLGIHGLLLDALLSVQMVTDAGELIKVSQNSHPDLFWGLRGAGMNFGIVTSATYRINDLTNGGQVMNADFIFPADRAPSLFKALKGLKDCQPKEMACIALIICGEDGYAEILLNLTYPGPQDIFLQFLQPFRNLLPRVYGFNSLPWNQLTTKSGFGIDSKMAIKGAPHSIFSVNLKEIDVPTWVSIFEKMNAFYATTPAGRTSAACLEIYSNEAMQEVPDESTAYPWRDSQGYAMFQMSWVDPSATDVANMLGKDLRSLAATTSGYGGLTTYVSYAHGDEPLEQMYGAEKLARLQALKQRWDPKNVFAYNNAIML